MPPQDIPDPAVGRLCNPDAPAGIGHPWAQSAELTLEGSVEDGASLTLYGTDTRPLGSGVFDRRDPQATWRRFSWAEGVAFDADYVAGAMDAAIGRRSEEPCQRLVSADADYLPGLVVEAYEDVFTVAIDSAAMEAHLDLVVEVLKAQCGPKEIVFVNTATRRECFGLSRSIYTVSGNNLKGRWVEIDGVAYRLDLMNREKPPVVLDQREQHVLVASLCEGRCVLDGFARSGGFALHAMRAGAEHAVALDVSESYVKAVGAHAQRNNCFVETICADVGAFLNERSAGDLDCIILDPVDADWSGLSASCQLHAAAFQCLSPGGLLATYCRCPSVTQDQFERAVSAAAGRAGREGRIFARTSQPFDFPSLLNFPESNGLKGLILQVE